jgi:hypothetical protein
MILSPDQKTIGTFPTQTIFFNGEVWNGEYGIDCDVHENNLTDRLAELIHTKMGVPKPSGWGRGEG